VKVERVKLYEWKDKRRGNWHAEYIGYLDPCKIEDEKELKSKINEWKEEVKGQYEDLVRRY